jgi:uncharacterized protein (DUF488 family)
MMPPIIRLANIETQSKKPTMKIFSIGHSNHTWDRFIDLLRRAGVTAIADVRSTPYSQRQPQFNRPELAEKLPPLGIAYSFLGNQLGGRPPDPDVYESDGRLNYERVRASSSFRDGISDLMRVGEKHSAAMLCAEEDPLHCHRGLMITPALSKLGIATVHLRGDGTAESTEEMEQRLIDETGIGAGILDGLFASLISAEERAERIADAYREMAKKRAFRQPTEQLDT